MSEFRRSNPVSFKLSKDFTAKDIDRIYDNLRRRARAAFKHQWESHPSFVETTHLGNKFKKDAEGMEVVLVGSWEEARTWADRSAPRLSLTPEQVKQLHWEKAQKLVSGAVASLRNYEADCFRKVRGVSHIKSLGSKNKVSVFGDAWTPKVKAIITRARSAYPWITSKNLPRLAKAIRSLVIGKSDPDPMQGYIPAETLLTYGIPAVELAGPWYDKKKFKSPVEWVRYKFQMGTGGLPRYSSPTLREWMNEHELDENDRQLRDSIQNYYDQHRAAPSVAWAQRRQRELEQERSELEIEENTDVVREWLEASKEWRLRDDVEIPVMPDQSYRVASPMDAHEICRRAAKDGLCVVDRLKDMVAQAQSDLDARREHDDDYLDNALWNIAVEEGVVTLVLLHDQQYRTVVGLNADGICTSKHHCTGRNNELDKNAWEYFRAK